MLVNTAFLNTVFILAGLYIKGTKELDNVTCKRTRRGFLGLLDP